MEIGGVRVSISALADGIYDFQTFLHFYPTALLPTGSRLMLGDYSLTCICTKPSPEWDIWKQSPQPKAADGTSQVVEWRLRETGANSHWINPVTHLTILPFSPCDAIWSYHKCQEMCSRVGWSGGRWAQNVPVETLWAGGHWGEEESSKPSAHRLASESSGRQDPACTPGASSETST